MNNIIFGLISITASSIVGILILNVIDKYIEPWTQRFYNKNPDRLFSRLLNSIFTLDKKTITSYQERIDESIINLKKSSKEIDLIINEIVDIGQEKQEMIESLEYELKALENREEELNQKVKVLNSIPIDVLTHFEKIIKKGERTSAKRDYFLFLSGVILSAIVAVVLNKLGKF